MYHVLQGIGAWLADWFLDRRVQIREFAKTQWARVRARNTGDHQ